VNKHNWRIANRKLRSRNWRRAFNVLINPSRYIHFSSTRKKY
jgi:hypothetical protein